MLQLPFSMSKKSVLTVPFPNNHSMYVNILLTQLQINAPEKKRSGINFPMSMKDYFIFAHVYMQKTLYQIIRYCIGI